MSGLHLSNDRLEEGWVGYGSRIGRKALVLDGRFLGSTGRMIHSGVQRRNRRCRIGVDGLCSIEPSFTC